MFIYLNLSIIAPSTILECYICLMQSRFEIIKKLEKFIRKFHINEILRGTILFFSIGLFYLLLILLIEYFFWLPPNGRKMLFWTFLLVESILLYRWIFIPFSKLIKLKKGISYEKSAKIIGDYFPEISDKLLNALQLQKMNDGTELLLASIEQKTKEMKSISFENAVSYSTNKKYLPYFALPFLVFIISHLIADSNWFGSSYNRMSNYNKTFIPPAPYSFKLDNDHLYVVQNDAFNLIFSVEGNRIPENVVLELNNERYSLQPDKNGFYTYTIQAEEKNIHFTIVGNNKVHEKYLLEVLPRPFIENIELTIHPPKHTQLSTTKVEGSGTAEIPEGSLIIWSILTHQSHELKIIQKDSTYNFVKKEQQFNYQQQVFDSFDYTLQAINKVSNESENMLFSIQVLKDAFPTISINSQISEIEPNLYEFSGVAEDDYGLHSLYFVIHPSHDNKDLQRFKIPISGDSFEDFYFKFDTREYISEEGSYRYYFEVTDNDAINGYKVTRSDSGVIDALSSENIKDSQLDFQKEKLDALSKNIKKWNQDNSLLEDIENLERTDETLKWEDSQKMESFLKQEKLSLENIENLTDELKQNLEKMEENSTSKNEKEQLQQRIEEQLQDLNKNQELLDKLEELQSKISQEDLLKEIDEFKQQKKIQEKNLGQLLELTKRFYVSEKNKKLASDLLHLGNKQEELSENDDFKSVKEEQEKLLQKFDKFKDEMEELQKENQQLLKPMPLYQDKQAEDNISKEQHDALEQLNNDSPSNSKPSQQRAGQQMKNMAMLMQQEQSEGGMQGTAEDANVLRQILDNLVRFSFSQEELIEVFNAINFNNPMYGNYLTNQHDLKQNFVHVNDSLFALSLRQPAIGKRVHELSAQIESHMEVSLDDLAQNRISNGVTQQQYVLTSSNELAVILSDILDNMQMDMQGGGQGSGNNESQLSDIIEQQKSLMEDSSEDGAEGESQGESNENGSDAKNGDSDGKENGANGDSGEGLDSYIDTEGENGVYYEIFKQQQELKIQLEEFIRINGMDFREYESILEDMDVLSFKMLEEGRSSSNHRQMQQILHHLLELEKASFQQNQDDNREATTNFNDFSGYDKPLKLIPKDKMPSTEILNRESFPLTPYYRRKVQNFFNGK